MKRSPFTSLCSQMAKLALPSRADLHVHTTASDGEYTPSQVVALARQAGLCAVAITDHDTLAGVAEACEAASGLEVVPAVEITTEWTGREFHLLGYFVQSDHPELTATLDRLCDRRRERFRDYLVKLSERGHAIPPDRVALVEAVTVSLGRRHVAGLLISCQMAKTRNEAFHRMLSPLRGLVRPKELLPLGDAIELVHDAGGVASLAHPPSDLCDEQFREFAAMGLDAIETEYAWGRSSPRTRLRELASRLGLLTTGGSDCHGPEPAARRIGTYAVTAEALERLRERCRLTNTAAKSA